MRGRAVLDAVLAVLVGCAGLWLAVEHDSMALGLPLMLGLSAVLAAHAVGVEP